MQNVSEGDIYTIIKRFRSALSLWRNSARLEDLKLQLQLQYRLEEEYWRTKSRILWLQAGDKNTRYFHSKTKQRRHINRITFLQDDQVTEDMNRKLTSPVTEQEIKAAVFAMDPDKSPGPDGMTPAFYRQHWETIKTDRVMERMGFCWQW